MSVASPPRRLRPRPAPIPLSCHEACYPARFYGVSPGREGVGEAVGEGAIPYWPQCIIGTQMD